MPKFVRVRDKETGHEFSTSEANAHDAKHLEILKDAEAERNGRPLAATPKTPAKKAATGS